MIIDAIGFVYDEYVKMVNHPHFREYMKMVNHPHSQSGLGNL